MKAKEMDLPAHNMADGESIRTMPAEFLLDKRLVVKKFHYSQRITDRLPLEEITAFAEDREVAVMEKAYSIVIPCFASRPANPHCENRSFLQEVHFRINIKIIS